MKSRKVEVKLSSFRGRAYRLNFGNGQWKAQVSSRSMDLEIDESLNRQEQEWRIRETTRASMAGITITKLKLKGAFKTIDENTQSIILQSGCSIPVLQQLRVLEMEESELNVELFVGTLLYCQQCTQLTEIKFNGQSVYPPLSVPTERIPQAMKARKMDVLLNRGKGLVWRLNFEDGQWEVHDPSTDQSLVIRISRISDSQLEQKCGIQELKIAEAAGITITKLELKGAFKTMDENTQSIILQSGCSIPPLQQLHVLEMEESELNVDMFVGTLLYCEQCTQLTEIKFNGRSVYPPLSVPTERIPQAMKARKVDVLLDRRNRLVYRLNFEDGQWGVHSQSTDQLSQIWIRQRDRQQEQEWLIQDMKIAAAAGVKINRLDLDGSFDAIPENTQAIILKTGSTIPVLHTLRDLNIWDTNFNQEMFVRTLSYAKECTEMTELYFGEEDSLPDEINPGMIPALLKQRGMRVIWDGYYPRKELDFDTGKWKRRKRDR